MSVDDEVESGPDNAEVEEGQMMAHSPPTMGGVIAIGGGAMVRSRHMELVPLNGINSVVPSSALDLCKPGDKMPGGPPKQLYTVLQEMVVDCDQNVVFVSGHVYVLPGARPSQACQKELQACCVSWLRPAGREASTRGLGMRSTMKRLTTLARSSSS
jgi:hypothetical protein